MDIPWWCYAIATLLGVTAWRVWKKPSLGLLAGYMFLVIAETVLIRKPFKGTHFRPELFWSWRAWKTQSDQILTNLVMFIPVGVFAGCSWEWNGLFVAVGLSTTVEILQLVTERGLLEFDDVFHNCAGAAIGIVIVMFMKMRGGAKNGV